MLERDREAIDYVLHEGRENDVKFIRLWFTDILGNLKGFAITIEELESAMTRGMGFDGSTIEGFARSSERDLYALPDPNTFAILPWRPRTNAVARMFCDIVTPDDEPFEGDPRFVLSQNLERAAALGYTYYVGPEIEYFYFKDSTDTQSLDQGGYFDQDSSDSSTDLRRQTVLTLEELGIPVESSHHEVAPSQHEIDLPPPPAESNVCELPESERDSLGIDRLPENLWEAIKVTENSELVHRALGEEVAQSFVENKKIEWDRYHSEVSEFEKERYTPVL